MTFARPARPEEQNVLALVYEGRGGQIENQTAIDLGIECEVEVVKAPVGIAESCLFATALQQPVGSPRQFIADETGAQINGCHSFGLSLTQACFGQSICAHDAETVLVRRRSDEDSQFRCHKTLFSGVIFSEYVWRCFHEGQHILAAPQATGVTAPVSLLPSAAVLSGLGFHPRSDRADSTPQV